MEFIRSVTIKGTLVLRDTEEPGGWRDALKLACDLGEKASLSEIFSIALGFLSPETWKERPEETRVIFNDRGFTCEPEDAIQIIAGALNRVPKERRREAVAEAKGLLNEDELTIILESLLKPVLSHFDHPWHKLIRDQTGEGLYRKIVDGLNMKAPHGIAEAKAGYSAKGKMTQMGLFD